MFNEFTAVGYLTKDPVSIPTTDFPKTIISVVSSKKYKKRDGTVGEHRCFLDCELYNNYATTAMRYLKRGSLVLVVGFLAFEEWTVFDPYAGKEVKKGKYVLKVDKMQMMPSSKTEAAIGNANGAFGDNTVPPEETPF